MRDLCIETSLVIRKLTLICRYCDDGMTDKALAGMGDVNESLIEVITRLLEGSAGYCPETQTKIDKGILVGSLQLALDAMQQGNMPELSAALREGVIAELEKAAGNLNAAKARNQDSGATGKSGLMDTDESGRPLYESIPAFPPVPCVVCLFGYGDGRFYELLCSAAAPESTFIVFEPETDTIVELREQLQENIDFYRLDTMQVLATPGYDTIFRTEYGEFIHAINENRERILVNKNTLKRFKDTASRNVVTNLHILQHCNLVGDIAHILPRSVPVIIVSAGPSLDGNIELLRKAKGHCLIFAVDTAMKYLMERDIMPDLGITVEPIKPMANYADDRCFDVPHIFDCESNPEIVSRERGRIFIYNCRDYVKRLLEKTGVEVAADVASGGSVATAAFAICYQLQMQTVIMIGQDLAYQGTATHAGGVESAGINGDIGYDMVDGVNGEPVRTRSDWKGYLRWFENAIKVINEQKLDMTVVDATEGGALIHGSHVMSLEDALERYCRDVSYDFGEALNRLPYVVSGDDLETVNSLIAQSFDELDEVKKAALEAVGLCDGVLKKSNVSDEAELPDRASDQASNWTLNRASDRASNWASDRVSDRASDRTSNWASDRVSNRASNWASDRVSDRTSNLTSNRSEACGMFEGVETVMKKLAGLRSRCEGAFMYPLINNYAVSDIIDEVSALRQNTTNPLSEVKQQRLAFEAIAGACDYFAALGSEK